MTDHAPRDADLMAIAATGAVVVVIVITIVAACAAAARRARRQQSPFYTGYATEDPTRDYIPYTGTIPYGTWGVTPWALV
jgi:hypothetical protein